ncbi:MAG: histidine phosphatase family protein [Candidatus Nealsonbacteria bacterium]|nr:histidine phosphatase family protein [Candidatus Nealsonbacteria bacterium]
MRLKNHYYFLRHGQTTWRRTDLSYPADNMTSVRLSPEGKKQVERAVTVLKQKGIDLIFSSDYLRTKQTAGIVSRALGIKPVWDRRLRDVRLGRYCGRPKEEYYRDLPLKTRFQKSPRGGESWNDLKKRVARFLKETEKRYQGKNILVVGHGDPLWLLNGVMKNLGQKELLNILRIRKEYIQKGELRKIN